MRQLILILIGLAIVALIVPALVLDPTLPDYGAISAPAGREERAAALRLGAAFEQAGEFDRAETEYVRAASGPLDAVGTAALAALDRVLTKKSDVRWLVRNGIQDSLLWAGENAAKLLLVLLVAVALVLFVYLLPRPRGYSLYRLDDYTGTDLGDTLQDLVQHTLLQARSIHKRADQDVFMLTESLLLPSVSVATDKTGLEPALSALDILGAGGINLPLGQLIGAGRRLLAAREFGVYGTVRRVSGDLEVTLTVQRARTSAIVATWTLAEPAQADLAGQAAQMIERLSYSLLVHMVRQPEKHAAHKRLGTCSSESLYHFSKGLKLARHYRDDGASLTALESAVDHLERSLDTDPGYIAARLNLALLHAGLGQFERSAEILRALKLADGGYVHEAAYNLGLAYYHRFQDWAYDLAEKEFASILTASDSPPSDVLRALAHCGLASVYAQRLERQNHADELLDNVQKHRDAALQIAPERSEVKAVAHSVLGTAHVARKAYSDAVVAFLAAIECRPDYLSNYIQLANAYYLQGNDAAAVEWLERATRRNPGAEYAHLRLGMIQKAQGEIDAAIASWRNAPHLANAQNELGKALVGREQYDEALAAFRLAVSLNKRHSEAWGNLAWYLVESGQRAPTVLEEAIRCARRSLNLEQGTRYEWHRRVVLGHALFACGRYEEAEHELLASLEKSPDRLQCRVALAEVYLAMGKQAEAQTVLEDGMRRSQEKGMWRDKAAALLDQLRQS